MPLKRGIYVPLFDLHCDTLTECVCKGENLYSNKLHWDISRALSYAPCVQVLAIWTPDTQRNTAATTAAFQAVDAAFEAEKCYAPRFRLWHKDEPFPVIGENQCLGILGLESAAPLAGSMERFEEFAEKGVKVITLTWNGDNEAASGVEGEADRGLTPFGKALVTGMERRKITVDVSHLNERGFFDVCERTASPFIASHSLSRAVFNHERNLTDTQFCEIVRRGGVVGLNLCAAHLGKQSFEQFERHLSHFLDLGGENTVALGFDLDGTNLPREWNGVAVCREIFAYLLERGYAKDLLLRLFFENARFFFQKV